jgi:transcriptional regulator with XRE-family HTH domain
MSKPDKILLELGRSIRVNRKKLKFTQAIFAKKVGLHRSYIGSVERGERGLSFLKVIQIATALKITVFELLSFLKETQTRNK